MTRFLLLSYLLYTLSHVAHANDPNPTPDTNTLNLLNVIQTTITNSPDILRQQLAQEIAAGRALIQTADFNTTFVAAFNSRNQREATIIRPQAAADRFFGGRRDVRNNRDMQDFKLGFTKKFENGMTANLDYLMSRNDPRDANAVAPLKLTTVNKTTVRFTLNIPFLKGAGEASNMARLNAANLENTASRQELQHRIANALLKTIHAYWDYRAATEQLTLRLKAEDRVKKWLSQSGNLTGALQSRMQGFNANKKRQTQTAEENLNTARLQLATAMGLTAKEGFALGAPTEDFSNDWGIVLNDLQKKEAVTHWQALALAQRADIQAAQSRLQAAENLLQKAEADNQSGLDLSVSVGYNGLTEGNGAQTFFDSTQENVYGAEHAQILTFTYPFENHSAGGLVDLRKAQIATRTLAHRELQRNIALAIETQHATVQTRLQETLAAEQTTAFYISSLQQLQKNPQVFTQVETFASLLDVEDKLTESLDNYLNALLNLAKTIATLRFQTGTLISVEADQLNQITLSNLTTLPPLP